MEVESDPLFVGPQIEPLSLHRAFRWRPDVRRSGPSKDIDPVELMARGKWYGVGCRACTICTLDLPGLHHFADFPALDRRRAIFADNEGGDARSLWDWIT